MSEFRVAHRRIMNMIARGVIESDPDDEPGVQQNEISLLMDESKAKVERFQNYGFSSSPPPGTEVIAVFVGGGRDHGIIVATDDRSSRFTGLKAGEVAIYSNEGDSITLKQDNTIEINTDKRLTIKAGENVDLETKALALKPGESFEIEAPTIKIKGNIELDGNLNGNGSINAPQGRVGP